MASTTRSLHGDVPRSRSCATLPSSPGLSRLRGRAFETSGHDSFIPPALVAAARKAQCEASGPLVIGFDPAWKGEDRHAMAWRLYPHMKMSELWIPIKWSGQFHNVAVIAISMFTVVVATLAVNIASECGFAG